MKSRLIASMAWCVLGGCVGYRLAPATNNHRPARGTGGGRGQIAQGRLLWHNGWMAMGLQLHPPLEPSNDHHSRSRIRHALQSSSSRPLWTRKWMWRMAGEWRWRVFRTMPYTFTYSGQFSHPKSRRPGLAY